MFLSILLYCVDNLLVLLPYDTNIHEQEEEEQLFSGAKEDSRVSEASRRVVQEEEERLILQKIPLQKKMVEIS